MERKDEARGRRDYGARVPIVLIADALPALAFFGVAAAAAAAGLLNGL